MIPNLCDTNNLSINQFQYFNEKLSHPVNTTSCIMLIQSKPVLNSELLAFISLHLIQSG
jgi:hypothetical protein